MQVKSLKAASLSIDVLFQAVLYASLTTYVVARDDWHANLVAVCRYCNMSTSVLKWHCAG